MLKKIMLVRARQVFALGLSGLVLSVLFTNCSRSGDFSVASNSRGIASLQTATSATNRVSETEVSSGAVNSGSTATGGFDGFLTAVLTRAQSATLAALQVARLELVQMKVQDKQQ